MSAPANPDVEQRQHPVEIEVDSKPVEAPSKTMTAREILVLVGKDPAQYYLVQLIGKKDQNSYKEKLDEPIHLDQHSRFITVSTGETPAS
jgi:uncharacterized protein YpmB